jgi:hypothetical protein
MDPRKPAGHRRIVLCLAAVSCATLAVAAPTLLALRPAGGGSRTSTLVVRPAGVADPTHPAGPAPAAPPSSAAPSSVTTTSRSAPSEPSPAPPSVPPAPAGLRAGPGDGEARLSWRPSPAGPVYYWVYQRDVTAGQGWKKLPLPLTRTSMTAGLLTNGHGYEFRVVAANLAGTSGPSRTVRVTPHA